MAKNEGLYCEVQLPTADIVLQGPRLLPETYKDYQNNSWKNLTDNTVWPDSELLKIGWYPYVLVDAGVPGSYYNRTLSDFAIQATEVVQTASYEQWPVEDVRQQKNLELEARVTIYTANAVAVDNKTNELILQDASWVADKQSDLARIPDSDWQSIADFDTSKPIILPLAENFVAQRYIEQGKRLSGENRNARDTGQPDIWDQTEIDNFVAANQPAANDVSGATPAIKPTYKLRQGIANVSEQAARIVIYRFETGDPNPALAWNYGVKILNRQDSRALYVFSYTNGTYLAWNEIVRLVNGTWGYEGLPVEQQYVPNDMGFIFSYGTNPAVENDYFTDRIDFPAGVLTDNFWVAWDRDPMDTQIRVRP